MATEISQATGAPSSSDARVESNEHPKRKRSVHYLVNLDDDLRRQRLEHPGSHSAPPGRPRDVPDLASGNGRWSGPSKWRPRSEDSNRSSLNSLDSGLYSDEPTPKAKNRHLFNRMGSGFADYDEPTPPAYTDEQIGLSTMLGNVNDKQRKPVPTLDDGLPFDVKWWQRRRKQRRRVPEQKITLFAFRLAMIEKAASSIGTMAFLWATVVILGGFATTITFTNFWVVTVIIVAEAARIFNRSHELEWQNFSTKSSEYGIFKSFIKLASNSLRRTPTSTAGHQVSPNIGTNTRAIGIPSNHNPNKKIFPRRAKEPGFGNRIQERRAAIGGDGPQSGRTWSRRNIPILPYVSNVVTSQAVSWVLYLAQVISALLCIGLSLWRLAKQKFCSGCHTDTSFPNVRISMNVFYALAVLEAGLFLLEKGYLECRMRLGNLLKGVRKDVCDGRLGEDYDRVISSFYHSVYHRCLEGSVFDGLDMDLVSFGIQWLQSEHFQQQLYGAKLLKQLIQCDSDSGKSYQDPLIADALRRLGTSPGTIERLVEMLSWTSQEEEELVFEIASIISGLVAYERNSSRIVAVPGALDAIVSLLLDNSDNSSRDANFARAATERLTSLRLTGLKILKHLSKTHKNSQKIGDTRGLLAILVYFLQVPGGTARRPTETSDWKVRKKSLKVLHLLAGATNLSGEAIRQNIAKIVSGLKNLRDIIEVCDERPDLQLLSMKVLYNLALEDNVRSSIGATSGTLRLLFHILEQNDTVCETREVEDAQYENDSEYNHDRIQAIERAGELLARLTVQNENNCLRLLNLKCTAGKRPLAEVMIANLRMQECIATSAAEILRNVMKYTDERTRHSISVHCAPIVLDKILIEQDDSNRLLYQACLGLASRTAGSLPLDKYQDAFGKADKLKFVRQLFRNLRHTPTTKKFPRIRRYSVELILALIKKDDSYLAVFDEHHLDIQNVLVEALDSISEVENFILFSGMIGYARHTDEIEELVLRCIREVEHYHSKSRLNPTSPSMEDIFS